MILMEFQKMFTTVDNISSVRASLVVALLFTVLLLLWKTYYKFIQLGNRIPGIGVWNLAFGLMNQMPKDGPHVGLLGFLMNFVNSHEGEPCRIWLLNELCVILTKPKDIEVVLGNVKIFKKSGHYAMMKRLMGQGLFTADDFAVWRRHRKIITPTLHFNILKDFVPIFYKQATKLANKTKDKEQVNIFSAVGLCTLDSICNTAMGINIFAQDSDNNTFLQDFYSILKVWHTRMTNPWIMLDLMFNVSRYREIHDNAADRMKYFTNEILHLKRDKYGVNKSGVTVRSESRSTAFLDMMLTCWSEHGLSDTELKDEIITLILAGQETTATVNSFALIMLAYHQNIQLKVQEELDSIFEQWRENDCPSFEDLQKMNYLEMVIKETLRLFPALPIIGRALNEDLQVNNVTIPAGKTDKYIIQVIVYSMFAL
ncbi:cytochrome P450 4V2 isoform X1 [Nilaparvata lugens]|uniref:cytochrome P450 4V2 isoform X1 n=2 Tax=Nilaparvata lugens TaxID=108931 RepID=UPI00193DC4BE|nr:cytochrome P450 4V2 isoform X1 [Nilaparvata lugens]